MIKAPGNSGAAESGAAAAAVDEATVAPGGTALFNAAALASGDDACRRSSHTPLRQRGSDVMNAKEAAGAARFGREASHLPAVAAAAANGGTLLARERSCAEDKTLLEGTCADGPGTRLRRSSRKLSCNNLSRLRLYTYRSGGRRSSASCATAHTVLKLNTHSGIGCGGSFKGGAVVVLTESAPTVGVMGESTHHAPGRRLDDDETGPLWNGEVVIVERAWHKFMLCVSLVVFPNVRSLYV